MQDRLQELGIEASSKRHSLSDSSDDDVEKGRDEEEGNNHTSKRKSKVKENEENGTEMEEVQQDTFLKEFFEEVNSIKTGMAQIRKNIRLIEETYSQSLVTVGIEQGQKTSEELERLIDATNLSASDVRNKLKEMDQDIKKASKQEKGSAQYRIKTNMHQTLTRKFLELMKEYQEVQTKYKNKYREKIERQYRIVKPNATQEEIDEAIDSGSVQPFQQSLLDNKKHEAAKDALAYIESKHKDILRIEQSIQELHQLFLDMAILVEAQGELIDQIEYNVSQSVAYTKEGVKELRKANRMQKKSRKKMYCIVILICIIFIALGGLGGIFGGLKI